MTRFKVSKNQNGLSEVFICTKNERKYWCKWRLCLDHFEFYRPLGIFSRVYLFDYVYSTIQSRLYPFINRWLFVHFFMISSESKKEDFFYFVVLINNFFAIICSFTFTFWADNINIVCSTYHLYFFCVCMYFVQYH